MTTPDTLELRNRIQAAHDHGMPNALVPVEVAQALLDRAEAAEGREAWQPIETAPRDGTRILATGGGLGDVVAIVDYYAAVGCWNTPESTLDDRDDEPEGYSRPLFWRPLPETPTTPKEESQ